MAFLTNKAFPGALGFGRISVGGSGRHLSTPATTVHRVQTLSNSGSGSLRAACEASGPRTVIFETSGTIILTSDITINNPYITIAGQSAPNPGITLRGGGITIRTNDVIIRHLRVRVGGELNGNNPNRNCFSVLGHSGKDARKVIISNCSCSWSTDQLYHAWAWSGGTLQDITFQDILAGEPLDASIHTEGAHPYGPLVGGGTASPERITFIRNLLVTCNERNPRIGKSTKSAEVINCAVFNWARKQTCNCKGDGLAVNLMLDFIGNCYIAGSDSDPASNALLSGGGIRSGTRVFAEGNICPTRPTDTGDEWNAVASDIPESPHKSLTRVADSGDGYAAMDPDDAYDWAVLNAGARPNNRDSVDIRIAGYAEDEVSVAPPDKPSDVGGWPNLVVNQVSHTLPVNHNAEGTGGYTKLENWLEDFHLGLAASEPTPDVPTPPPPPFPPPPTPSPEPLPSTIIVSGEVSVGRYKAQRFANVNGDEISTAYIDSRDQILAATEVISKLKD